MYGRCDANVVAKKEGALWVVKMCAMHYHSLKNDNAHVESIGDAKAWISEAV